MHVLIPRQYDKKAAITLLKKYMRNQYKTMLFYRKWSKKMFSFSEEIASMQIPLFTKLIVCLDLFWTLELALHGFLIKKIML